MTTAALIVAAGRGSRFGGALPKQYVALEGRPVLRHAVECFARHPRVDLVRVAIHPDDRALYDAAVDGLEILEPVAGAEARQDTVRLGLESLETVAPDRVLIHDGARPFVTAEVIDRVLDALEADGADGAIAALKINDTVKRADEHGRIAETLDRTHLWRAQTPQGFRFPAILAAHRAARGLALTDDAAVAERAGLGIALVEGAVRNLKVTTNSDLPGASGTTAEGGQSAFETRTGLGFDVHRLGPGDAVVLCGLRIPHDRRLLGHSDADVGLHALTDAILGTLGLGDIGTFFPPSDPQWRGADSAIFLEHARDAVAARGGRIGHVDVTLICERPKIGPHREAMRARLAELLALPLEAVSVKATTSEGLGFTGRGEGIAAQAVASVELPRRA